jgi:hypothetical protein
MVNVCKWPFLKRLALRSREALPATAFLHAGIVISVLVCQVSLCLAHRYLRVAAGCRSDARASSHLLSYFALSRFKLQPKPVEVRVLCIMDAHPGPRCIEAITAKLHSLAMP